MNRLAGFVCERGGEGIGKKKKRNILILLVNLSSYLALIGMPQCMYAFVSHKWLHTPFRHVNIPYCCLLIFY